MSAATLRLRSSRLLLEPLTESAIGPEYLGWLNDPEVTRFSNQRFRRHTDKNLREYLGSFGAGPNMLLALQLADEGRMIGTMTAYVAEPHGTADMGLMIGDKSLWGRGYGLEAWSTLMAHLLGARGLRKVTGGAVRANAAMCSIMERSGMHLEAVRRRQEIIDGAESDILLFARFRDR
jgi:RimJ/RimL family protein N-acetyltransferase